MIARLVTNGGIKGGGSERAIDALIIFLKVVLIPAIFCVKWIGVARMAHEADNLVLVQLREIRATLAGHSVQFTMIRERFDQIDNRFEDFHALTNHTLMLGTSNSLKSHDVERRYEFSEGEQRRLRERMDELEIRLSEVERKMDD